MSYDLHGVWDSTNPIGSIVQAHTNLTEINLAAELFWRVNIPPSKLALGFGFYGRAFTLADPSCTTPGCPFSGGAKPGVCTGTSGCESQFASHPDHGSILTCTCSWQTSPTTKSKTSLVKTRSEGWCPYMRRQQR
jgi:chitinase